MCTERENNTEHGGHENEVRKQQGQGNQQKGTADFGADCDEACYTLEARGGIESRNNDEEDFPEVSVNAIQEMLEKAYLLGKADADKEVR